jgi:hypothetical protein
LEAESSPTADQPKPKLRWFRLTPDRIVVALLVVEGFLLLSEWFDWFAFNHQTWTVLIALAAVGLTLLSMLLWFVMALLFRWRFQYGIRSLMLLVVAVAVAFSWVAVEMRNERRQGEAASAIRKARGGVESQWTWLGRVLRDRSLVRVKKVVVPEGSVAGDVFVHFGEIRELRLLGLSNGQVTDAGLVYLQGLKQLQGLCLDDTQVTDAGLVHLRGSKQLRRLDLNRTRITDAGLVHLRELKQLQALGLGGNQVTDVGLEHLRGLKRLQALSLYGTKVTDQGVEKLQQALPNCEIDCIGGMP